MRARELERSLAVLRHQYAVSLRQNLGHVLGERWIIFGQQDRRFWFGRLGALSRVLDAWRCFDIIEDGTLILLRQHCCYGLLTRQCHDKARSTRVIVTDDLDGSALQIDELLR